MSVKQSLEKLKKVITLCEQHGYIHQTPSPGSSPGCRSPFSYGPLGAEFRRNMTRSWWRDVVTHQEHVYGIDSPLDFGSPVTSSAEAVPAVEESTDGGDGQSPPGVSDDNSFHSIQNILPHYESALTLSERRFPVGLAQLGHCHNNNKTFNPDRFIFQPHAYSYFNLCFFCAPKDASMWHNKWLRLRLQWWRKFCGTPSVFTSEELKNEGGKQVFEIKYPFPWGEDVVERLTNDGGSTMERYNGKASLKGKVGRKFVLPHLIQSVGYLEGGMLAYLLDAYQDAVVPTQKGKRKRQVLQLHHQLCPIKVAVVTMESSDDVQEVSDYMTKEFRTADINVIQTSALVTAKPFEKLDKMGIPFAVLISEDTTKSGRVKIRSRDTTLLQEVHISKVKQELQR